MTRPACIQNSWPSCALTITKYLNHNLNSMWGADMAADADNGAMISIIALPWTFLYRQTKIKNIMRNALNSNFDQTINNVGAAVV